MIFYDLLLLLALPFIKKKRHHYQRLFAPIPDRQGKEVIWIHAVSVGEARAAQSLFRALRAAHPQTFFLITSTTAAGLAEARRCLSEASAFAYLPIDFSWIVRRWAEKLRPKLFLLIEGDIWPNLLSAIKNVGGATALVSGKLSERSASRFAMFPYFSRKLFARLDLLCIQNEEHRLRFLPLVDPFCLHLTGNLKFDHRPEPVDAALWRSRLSLPDPAITLSCTHAPEEDDLLDLLPLDQIFLFLVPRHPERFEAVAAILRKKSIPFFRWSCLEERRGGERVLLVDAMGQLPICYTLSRLAIVAGSFTPEIGGHNVLEPCLYGIPVLFGPYTFSQKELAARVLEARAGRQVSSAEISLAIKQFLNTPAIEESARFAVRSLVESGRGAAAKTLQLLETICPTQR